MSWRLSERYGIGDKLRESFSWKSCLPIDSYGLKWRDYLGPLSPELLEGCSYCTEHVVQVPHIRHREFTSQFTIVNRMPSKRLARQQRKCVGSTLLV